MAFPVMCGVVGHAGAGNRECKDGLRMGLLCSLHNSRLPPAKSVK